MLFNSYLFLILYLPVVFTGFFTFSKLRFVQLARVWLLLCSLWFYAYWDIRFLPLLLSSILFNYGCGCLLFSKKHFALWLGIAGNLALLFYFKYAHFFLSMVSSGNTWGETLLPLGISFFTFTQIAYLVDCRNGQAEASDLISYGLFVTVFPHLIAGPILHHKEMLKQFNHLKMYILNWSNIAQGLFLFTIGMGKKVLIADYLASFVQPVFNLPHEQIPFLQAWIGSLSYTLQLYFDFSGYSDMAVGLGLLFNLRLPINFNSPYKADSIIDFWRRWHITLSHFLRDYLYISLGGNRGGRLLKWRNLFLTMLLGGLWHGAGWTFVLWGACHGVFLIINHAWREWGFGLSKGFSKMLTLLAVILTWVIFRSPDLQTAGNIIYGMIGGNGVVLPVSYEQTFAFLKPYGLLFRQFPHFQFRLVDMISLAFIFTGALLLPNSNQLAARFHHKPLKWAAVCACLFLIAFIQMDDLAEFLYYQF